MNESGLEQILEELLNRTKHVEQILEECVSPKFKVDGQELVKALRSTKHGNGTTTHD